MFLPQARQGVLIRVVAGAKPGPVSKKAAASAAKTFKVGSLNLKLRPLLPSLAGATVSKFAAPKARAVPKLGHAKAWQLADPDTDNDEMHPWDLAHAAADELGAGVDFVEPDLLHRWDTGMPERPPRPRRGAAGIKSLKASMKGGSTGAAEPDDFWPSRPEFAWHLGLSQLDRARERASTVPPPTIMHLDTGYHPAQAARPRHILHEHEWNVVDEGRQNDATDPFNDGLGNQPGHGAGTIGILAGGVVANASDGTPFGKPLGAAPNANIIPVRIGDSVVHLWTSTMGAGLEYVVMLWERGVPIDAVSISMGGFPTQIWADAVAKAYAAGIVIAAAAGNRFGPAPPYQMVWPARFPEVIAAVGVTADETPYKSGWAFWKMEGCTGPREDMRHALGAYTPNIPWARWGSGSIIDLDGGGTSAATPQIAAAAAHYAAVKRDELSSLSGPQRVEAIRSALFHSASPGPLDKFGNGVLRANDALAIPVAQPKAGPKAMKAAFPAKPARWPLVQDLFADAGERADMLALESLQLVESSLPLIELQRRLERSSGSSRRKLARELGGALSVNPHASRALRRYLASRYTLKK